MTDQRNELDLRRQQQLADLRRRTGTAERFTQGFACAAHDREFQAVFVRMPPAKVFTCERIERAENKTSVLDRMRRLFSAAPTLKVSAADIAFDSMACPGCGLQRAWTLCHECHAFVCAGESEGDQFACRASCGNAFRTAPLVAFDAAKGAASGGQTAIGHAQDRSLPGKAMDHKKLK